MPHRALGARAPHPAEQQLSPCINDGLRSTPCRGRTLHTNHCGYGKGFPLIGEFGGFGVKIQVHTTIMIVLWNAAVQSEQGI